MNKSVAVCRGKIYLARTLTLMLIVWFACSLLIYPSPLLAQDGIISSPDGQFVVVVEVDQPTPLVGQAVIYRVKFYTETATSYEYTEPDFSGWWRGEQLTTSGGAEFIGSRQYSVTLIETLLYPLQTGITMIDSAQIIIPETVFSARVELISAPMTIQVQPLPDNAPISFTGAVGRYSLAVEVDQTTVMLGAPVTLKYRVNGEGNLAALPPPHLTFPDGWRAYPNPSTLSSQTRGFGERVFEWRLIPERAGTHTFPVYAFAYFDPQLGAYQIVETTPFVMDVLPTPDGQRELIRFERDANDRIPMALALKAISSGDTSTGQTSANWAWLLPPLAVFIVGGSQRIYTWQRTSRIRRRQTGALKVARARLDSVIQMSPPESYRQLQTIIAQYVADKLNLSDVPQQFSTIVEALQVYKLDLESLHLCWLQAEDGRYAPLGIVDLSALARETLTKLTKIDEALNHREPSA